MTTPKKPTGTGGNHGNYDYMKLLNDFKLVTDNFDWMVDAACRGRNDIDFFPEIGYNGKAPFAVAVCDTCKVKEDCVEFAIENRIEHGIWGGLSPQQRKRYRRTQKLDEGETRDRQSINLLRRLD
jgi:WhiB family redox-sensing transcriptional regulator